MRSILLLEPSRLHYPHLCRPLGALTLAEALGARGIECAYIDLADLAVGGQAEALVDRLEGEMEGHHTLGLSVTYRQSFALAREMAVLVKARHPDKRIIVGGRHIVTLYLNKGLTPEFFSGAFDVAVLFDGEEAASLLMEGEADLEAIPNLVFRRGDEVVTTRVSNDLDLDEVPLVIGASNNQVFEYEIGRGCYWHSCHFCEYNMEGYAFGVRERSIERISEDLGIIQRLAGARPVFLITDSMSLRQAREISQVLIDRGACIAWFTLMRFERGLDLALLTQMRRSGCVLILFGLESGDGRVNREIINKGIDLDDASRILKDCHDVGIRVYLSAVTGVPTETLSEALRTFWFFYRNRERIHQGGIHPFTMSGHGSYARDPERYGIVKIVPREEGYLFFGRGALYRHLMMKPLVAMGYIFFHLFTDIDFSVMSTHPVIRRLKGGVDRVIGREGRKVASRRRFRRTIGGRIQELMED